MGNNLNDIIDYSGISLSNLSDRDIYAEVTMIVNSDDYVSNFYYYVESIINDRWFEAESIIIISRKYACFYACEILGRRWVKAEPIIRRDKWWWFYYRDYLEISLR